LLPALLSAACGGALLWFLVGAREIRLAPVPTVPRPPVVSTAGAVPLSFVTITRPPHASGDELRELHNHLVASVAEALEAYEQGTQDLREVEHREMRLLAVRRKLGVIDTQAYHQQMALLLGRELQRVEALAAMDPPRASARALLRARCFHARELHFAGTGDAQYAALRDQVLGELEERLRYLPPARKDQRASLQDELDALRQVLPAP
jgi:hypothetical protein